MPGGILAAAVRRAGQTACIGLETRDWQLALAHLGSCQVGGRGLSYVDHVVGAT